MNLLWPLCLLGLVVPLCAQTAPLSREQLLDLARKRAPIALSSAARIEEARSRVVGASVRFRENPAVDLEAGRRRTAEGENLPEFDIGVAQPFELGGKRAARIAGAQAGVERESALAGNALRVLLRDVSEMYFRTIAAQKRVHVASAAVEIANELLRVSNRRFQAGDIAQLELNLAKNAAARANAELKGAQAEETSAYAALRGLLGLRPDEPLAVSETPEPNPLPESEYAASAESRPDLRTLESEVREAQATSRLGNALRVPDTAFGLRHKREEGANATVGTLSLTLPLFNRGQEERALGTARARRAQIELDALRSLLRAEVSAAYKVSQARHQAVRELTEGALPQLEENERLTVRSYEEGEIGLAELLLIRRETFDTRREYIDRSLAASLALVELEFVSGVLR